MGYVARVSNPQNQENPNVAGLLKYCITHNHWSVFEQAHMTLEIETNRGIAAQILRHRSFTYQEFSQRYADVNWLESGIPVPDLRSQDHKNRQNSIDDISPETKKDLQACINRHFISAMDLYNELLRQGVAKECARFVLPLATPTKKSWLVSMTGTSGRSTTQTGQEIGAIHLLVLHLVRSGTYILNCQEPILGSMTS